MTQCQTALPDGDAASFFRKSPKRVSFPACIPAVDMSRKCSRTKHTQNAHALRSR